MLDVTFLYQGTEQPIGSTSGLLAGLIFVSSCTPDNWASVLVVFLSLTPWTSCGRTLLPSCSCIRETGAEVPSGTDVDVLGVGDVVVVGSVVGATPSTNI